MLKISKEDRNLQNYGNVKKNAIRINNVISEIFEKLEEVDK